MPMTSLPEANRDPVELQMPCKKKIGKYLAENGDENEGNAGHMNLLPKPAEFWYSKAIFNIQCL
jgi:hypothetical protein